jgi:hypothetical protein
MSDALNGKPPTLFWVIAVVLLLWNFTGLMFYYGQVTMTLETLAANFSAAEREFMAQIPVWATAAYATAVTAGVIGAVLLLLRKALALPFFVLSFVGVLIQDFDAFVLSDVVGVWGTSAFTLPVVVIVICVFEIWYTRLTKAKAWLT